MRTTMIFLAFLFSTVSIAGQEAVKNDIQCFNDFLGEEKAAALNAAVESFELFLWTNYPEHNGQATRTKAFLNQIVNLNGADTSWVFHTKKNKQIIRAFENSGLRKEIWIYGHEINDYVQQHDIYELLYPGLRYSLNERGTMSVEEDLEYIVQDSINIDNIKEEMEKIYMNSLHFNFRGSFLYGLLKCNESDALIKEYVKNNETRRGFAPTIIANAFLELDIDVEDPFTKRIIVVEIYHDLMNWDIQRKE